MNEIYSDVVVKDVECVGQVCDDLLDGESYESHDGSIEVIRLRGRDKDEESR